LGAAALRLALLHFGSAPNDHGTGLTLHGTEGATLRTRLVVGHLLGLLFDQGSERSLGEPLSGGQGNGFHGSEVDIEAGAPLAEGMPRNNFTPLLGQFAQSS